MLNKIMLIGNLGRDPELSYTQNGKAIAKFSLAVSRRRRDESGEQREETQWLNIVAWERLAETCNNYLKKGSKVYIEGRMTSRKYTSEKDGIERTVWDVVASDMEMLTPKGGDGSGGGSGYGDEMGADDVPF